MSQPELIKIRNTSKHAIEFAVRTNAGEKVRVYPEGGGTSYEKDAAPAIEVVHIPAANGKGYVEINKSWFESALEAKMEVAEIVYEQQEITGVTLDKKTVSVDVAVETGRRILISAVEFYLKERKLEIVTDASDTRIDKELKMIEDLRELGLTVASDIPSERLNSIYNRFFAAPEVAPTKETALQPAAAVAAPVVPVVKAP